MRLIDGDALLKTIEKHCYQVQYDRTSIEKGMTLTGIRQAINEQPEAVGRCKDCKWYNDRERTCNDLMGFGRYWKPDDFCSYWKRRTDETD